MSNAENKTDKKPHRCRRCLILGMVFVLFWLPGFAWFYQQIPTSQHHISPSVHTDAVVVLTGAKGRLESGLELLRQERADVLFISGVGEGVQVHELADVAGIKADDPWLLKMGEDARIQLGREARSTVGNAKEVVAWMHEKDYESMLLVTSFYHVPRSMMELKATMPNVVILPMPVFPSAKEGGFTLLGHHLNEWRLILLEYHKYFIRRAMLALSEA